MNSQALRHVLFQNVLKQTNPKDKEILNSLGADFPYDNEPFSEFHFIRGRITKQELGLLIKAYSHRTFFEQMSHESRMEFEQKESNPHMSAENWFLLMANNFRNIAWFMIRYRTRTIDKTNILITKQGKIIEINDDNLFCQATCSLPSKFLPIFWDTFFPPCSPEYLRQTIEHTVLLSSKLKP
jgi:hypothetical protein